MKHWPPPLDSETATEPLLCVECATHSAGDARGWRAYIAFLEEDGEPPELVVVCPACAEREFDGG